MLRFSPVQSCPSLQGGQRGWVRPGGRPAASGTGGLGAREGPHEGSSSSQRVSPSLRRPLKPHRSGAFLPHWVPGSAQRQIGVSRLDLVFRVDQLPGSGSAEPPNILDSKAAVAAGSARGRWQSRGPCSFSPAAPVVGKARGLPPPWPALGRVSAQTRCLLPGVLPLCLQHPGRGTEPPGTCCWRKPAGLSCGPCTWRPGRHGPGFHGGHGPSAAEQMWLSRDGAGVHPGGSRVPREGPQTSRKLPSFCSLGTSSPAEGQRSLQPQAGR